MYTNQATNMAQGLLARLSTSTVRMTTLIASNFRIPKLVRVNYFCNELTLKRSSQLQSGFIQVQVVVLLLLQGFSVAPLVQ